MKAIEQLKSLGYEFKVKKGKIQYEYLGPLCKGPPPDAGPLLKDIRQHKEEAIAYIIRKMVMQYTAKEWAKKRNEAKTNNDWIRFNAYKRLREAIDKNKKSDIETWTWIASHL